MVEHVNVINHNVNIWYERYVIPRGVRTHRLRTAALELIGPRLIPGTCYVPVPGVLLKDNLKESLYIIYIDTICLLIYQI